MSDPIPLRLDANLKWLFTELPFEQRFDAAAQAGFTAVEFPSPYEYPAEQLIRRLADAGLRQILLNTPTGPPDGPTRSGCACQPDRVAEFRNGLLSALDYATALDVPIVHVMGGIQPPDVPRDQAFATYVANLAWAVAQAEQTGVTLVLEAINRRDVPGFVLESLEQADGVVQAIGSDRLALLFDVYHCQVGQGDVATRWRRLYPRVAHVQIGDAPDRTEPGTGELNWEFLFGEIARTGYTGWIGCEYHPVADTAAGLAWRDRYSIGAAPAATR